MTAIFDFPITFHLSFGLHDCNRSNVVAIWSTSWVIRFSMSTSGYLPSLRISTCFCIALVPLYRWIPKTWVIGCKSFEKLYMVYNTRWVTRFTITISGKWSPSLFRHFLLYWNCVVIWSCTTRDIISHKAVHSSVKKSVGNWFSY